MKEKRIYERCIEKIERSEVRFNKVVIEEELIEKDK